MFQQLSSKDYATYAASDGGSTKLPDGWNRVEIPFGHNTCAP